MQMVGGRCATALGKTKAPASAGAFPPELCWLISVPRDDRATAEAPVQADAGNPELVVILEPLVRVVAVPGRDRRAEGILADGKLSVQHLALQADVVPQRPLGADADRP